MSNIYIICGLSHRLINREIEKIVKTDNIIYLNYNECGMSFIIGEACYMSLDGIHKYIIIKNCDIFKNKDIAEEELLKYTSSGFNTSTLIFVVDSIDARKKIVKTVKDNNGLIIIPKIDYKNVYDYIKDYVLENGYKIDYKTSNYLVNNVGLNIDLLFNELDKMFLYYNKKTLIELDDVRKITVRPVDNNMYHFLDACMEKNFDRALKIYKDLKIYKIEDIALVITMAYEFKKMYFVKKMLKNHENNSSIMKSMGLLDWQFDKIYNHSLNFTESELQDIIKYLAKMDEKIKRGKINKDVVINNVLLYLFA